MSENVKAQIAAALATPDGFRIWLEQSKGVIFTACAANDCPLAEYVESLSDDIVDVEVYGNSVRWWDSGYQAQYARTKRGVAPIAIALPAWASKYVAWLDVFAGDQVAPVSAAECLAVLEEMLG